MRALVRGYQLLFSAWVGGQCRFHPTCSAYAMQALERHGAAAGSYLAVARLCRCHPGCEGGLDEVPAAPPRLFTHWNRTFQPTAPGGPKDSTR